MQNHIHNVSTQIAKRNGQDFPMIVIGLDISDLSSLDSFMKTVEDTFRNQRMCSPPQTSGVFFTLIGAFTADAFKERWILAAQSDPIIKAFMSMMTEATVLHGKPDGTVISHVSLI